MVTPGNNRAPVGSRSHAPLPVGDSPAIVILALFVTAVVSVPKYDLPGVIAFAAFPLMLVTATRIPLMPILKRLSAASPFILFMAGGNLLLDRAPAADIAGVIVSCGMLSAAVIAMKAMITLSSLLSLMTLMPFHRFGTALRSLAVPEVFVTQLLLVYRYSFLLSEEAAMMQKARDLRSFDGRGKGPIVTAKLIGSLLIRTTSKAERIYMAMAARGFREGLAPKPRIPLSLRELGTIACAFVLFVIVRIVF